MPEGASIAVGFSGGPDSLALAASLATLRPVLGADVRLIHVDHGLRPTSSEDAERAKELAASLGLEFHLSRLDPVALGAHAGVGVEEAARRERYRSFTNVVACDTQAIVALGHHQMDQAETVLLHLLRGAGLRGATGMAEMSALVVPWWETDGTVERQRLNIWRPFISEPRVVVRNYIESSGLSPVEDESNHSVDFQRNAIRHRLLPVMEELSPGAAGALARFAELAAEDDRFLSCEAERVLSAARNGPTALSIDSLVHAPLSLRRRVILMWLSEYPGIDPSQDRVDAILRLIEQRRRGPTIEIGGGYLATTTDADLVVRPDS